MLSIAQIDHGPAPGQDALVDRVATAAFDSFVEYGIRRSTIEDVATRAGVSKMTVFRRFQNKQGLVQVVIAREIRRAMEQLDDVWEREQTLEQRLVLGLSFAVNFVRGHPLLDRLLRSEPELLLPLLTVDGAPALALYRELIAKRLQAEVIARLAMSLLLTREGKITLDDDDTIVALVRHTLLPMLRPCGE